MDVAADSLSHLSAEELREMVQSLRKTVTFKQAAIDKLTHENALLKRLKFAAQSERFNAEQRSLLEETLDEDLQAVSEEIAQLSTDSTPARVKDQPKRQALPVHLPRIDILHEPDSTTCRCGCQMKRVGEDVAEKLDYQPGVFSVERHVRGKWACARCETLVQAPVPAHVIDKGIPTTGLLAQVLVAKFADHLPLYHREAIFGRAGLDIPRSTLGAWVGNCGVQLQALVDALKEDSREFQAALKAYGMTSSMSRKADCWGNAPTESLWSSLKRARLHGRHFATRQAAQSEVMEWLAAQEKKSA